MDYKIGDILKLSEEGLDYVSTGRPKWREKASKWRFEFRCIKRNEPSVVTVLKIPFINSYYCYHHTFLEKVSPQICPGVALNALRRATEGFMGLIGKVGIGR